MSEQEKELTEVQNDDYTCPSCGASMSYDPSTCSLKCPSCGNIKKINFSQSNEEIDFNSADKVDNKSWENEFQVIRCQECDAENVISKKTMTNICPFCGSKQVVKMESLPGLKPNRVIPFQISLDIAKQKYQEFIKNKFFASSKIKKLECDLSLNGVYIPSWTFDTDTFSMYNGRLGEYYYVTVRNSDGKGSHQERRTRWFRINGTYREFFDDILVNAGKSITQKEMNSLHPFDTNHSAIFEESCLAGFGSEHYSKNLQDGFSDAKNIAKYNIERHILNRYRHDTVDYLSVKTSYNDVKFKYVILPVWIGVFNYNNKKYRFLVNGENGKVYAKYPLSVLKISILVVLGIIALIFFFYFFGREYRY